ncbi:class I SAM-dependent methyltransferase [Gammaproteobacteria bacterium]|nr:class I SAM-dependent methyltransferase [Gammaproteobacteria bacterium]
MNNKDSKVIEEFGEEWSRYKYDSIDQAKLMENFEQYSSIFPWHIISNQSEGYDMGCGTGRWAQFFSPKVKTLNCIEPSIAIEVAKENLATFSNIKYFNETTDTCSLAEGSQDFGYSLGVLHHIPDTQAAILDCVKLLKKDAPLLLYLYYSFENKPLWFKAIWRLSDLIRIIISKLPSRLKKIVCEIIALIIYLPLTRSAYWLEKTGFNVDNIPLTDYRKKPFYQMRNDALDRFGTRLEQRFSKDQITEMLTNSGCNRIEFSNETPYWCVVAFKA